MPTRTKPDPDSIYVANESVSFGIDVINAGDRRRGSDRLAGALSAVPAGRALARAGPACRPAASSRSFHERPQCAHLTKRGTRCKNETLAGRLFCAHHDPDAPASPKWAAVARAVKEHPGTFGKKGE